MATPADPTLTGFRATVLSGMVRTGLKRGDWEVEPIRGAKRDLLAVRGERRLRVVPLFVLNRNSKLLDRVVARVRGTRTEPPEADQRIVVIPSSSNSPTTTGDEDPQVLMLSDFISRTSTHTTRAR